MFVGSNRVDVCARLVPSRIGFYRCFHFVRNRVNDWVGLVVRLHPLLNFIIVIPRKVLGAWTKTTVVQASNCFYASGPPMTNEICSPLNAFMLPSSASESEVHPIGSICVIVWTRFKSDNCTNSNSD